MVESFIEKVELNFIWILVESNLIDGSTSGPHKYPFPLSIQRLKTDSYRLHLKFNFKAILFLKTKLTFLPMCQTNIIETNNFMVLNF